MKAILENGSYKAVKETTTTNYYCWKDIYGNTFVWTLSATPNTGDDVIIDGAVIGYVTSYDSVNDTIIFNYNTFSRYSIGDFSQSTDVYKLINQ